MQLPSNAEKHKYQKYLKGLGHAILGKRQIGRARVFHLQNQGHITTENDFPAV